MRILGPAFVARYEGRMLNIHPSLLPAYPGLAHAPPRAGRRRAHPRLHRALRDRRRSTTARSSRRARSPCATATTKPRSPRACSRSSTGCCRPPCARSARAGSSSREAGCALRANSCPTPRSKSRRPRRDAAPAGSPAFAARHRRCRATRPRRRPPALDRASLRARAAARPRRRPRAVDRRARRVLVLAGGGRRRRRTPSRCRRRSPSCRRRPCPWRRRRRSRGRSRSARRRPAAAGARRAGAEPVAATEPEAPPIEPTAEAIADRAGTCRPRSSPRSRADAARRSRRRRRCRRRVDLVYKAFLGTQGFLIGEAIYRFEHAGNEYQITTIGEAKGLAALFLRGQGKLESRGLITADRPAAVRVRGRARQQGPARNRGLRLGNRHGDAHEQKTEALELSTFDPLTLMWQAYFSPPVDDVQDDQRRDDAARRPLHAHARRGGDDRVGAGRDRHRALAPQERGRQDRRLRLARAVAALHPGEDARDRPYRGSRRPRSRPLLDSIRVDETLARQ